MNISEPHLRRVQKSPEEAPPESGSDLERTHAYDEAAGLAGALHEVSNALTVVLGWLATVRGEPLPIHVREALDVAEQHARRGHKVARSAIGAGSPGATTALASQDVGAPTKFEGLGSRDRSRSMNLRSGKVQSVGLEGVALESGAVESGEIEYGNLVPRDAQLDDTDVKLRNVASLVQDVVTAVLPAANEKGVRVQTTRDDAGAADESMVAGADALLQVLVNLAMNAIAFSPPRGVVRITTRATGGLVVFAVADQGPGVPLGQQQRLFERGQSMRPGGAGIGLSHSRRLALQSGGSLNLVKNQGGATFEVAWPARELPSQTICKSPFLRGTKVLVLEDDDAVMDMVRFGLESRGAQVFHAANLVEVGVLTSVHRDFTLALLDLSPINGQYQFASQELRRSQPALPLILMSGSATAGTVELDSAAWVKKPFELSELYDTMQSVMLSPACVSAKRS